MNEIMKTDLVKIKASDYGLEESKAKEIEALFLPMLAKMSELEDEYNNILKEEINPETCRRAKELRLCYVKVRTGTAEIHKKAKEFYLNGGRFVDGWKNAQLFASGEKEKNLKAIEDYYENLENARLEKLRADRAAMLKPFTDIEPLALGHMEQAVFDNYLAGVKLAYEAKIAAEKKAEEDRIAREKADAAERERIRLENIRLQKEAKEREAQIEAERKKVRLEQEKRDAELAMERARIEKEREAERKAAEAERQRQALIQADLKAKADAERIERERIESELRAKQEAEKQAIEAEKRRKAAEEKRVKLAPDKTKLLLFMQAINDLPRPEVTSIEAADITSKANIYLVQAANYIRDNANKL